MSIFVKARKAIVFFMLACTCVLNFSVPNQVTAASLNTGIGSQTIFKLTIDFAYQDGENNSIETVKSLPPENAELLLSFIHLFNRVGYPGDDFDIEVDISHKRQRELATMTEQLIFEAQDSFVDDLPVKERDFVEAVVKGVEDIVNGNPEMVLSSDELAEIKTVMYIAQKYDLPLFSILPENLADEIEKDAEAYYERDNVSGKSTRHHWCGHQIIPQDPGAFNTQSGTATTQGVSGWIGANSRWEILCDSIVQYNASPPPWGTIEIRDRGEGSRGACVLDTESTWLGKRNPWGSQHDVIFGWWATTWCTATPGVIASETGAQTH